MIIRAVQLRDLPQWSLMRTQLWPATEDGHVAELQEYFAGVSTDIVEAFVLDGGEGELAGFLEMNIRNFAEGSRSPRLPYVEAWFVREAYRGLGWGKALMARAEQWAAERGYRELASDTELHNTHSIALHKALGFRETERIVCFLKTLEPGATGSCETSAEE